MLAINVASSRVLIVFNTAPVIGTAKCNSIISGTFGHITETVWPGQCQRVVVPMPTGDSVDPTCGNQAAGLHK